MAQQKFNNAFREALWETYGKKCFHCAGELLLSDMRIDHIVPEHLEYGDPEKRTAVLDDIGLVRSFNILGSENLAPSCEKCNGQKSGSIMVGRSAAIALTRIQSKLKTLDKNLTKKRKARELEDILLAVGRSLESGKFTTEEFSQQLFGVLQSYPNVIAAIRTSVMASEQVAADDHAVGTPSRRLPNLLASTGAIDAMMSRMPGGPDKSAMDRIAIFHGLMSGRISAKKVANVPNRYVIKGQNKAMGLDEVDILFDVRDDTVTIVAPHQV